MKNIILILALFVLSLNSYSQALHLYGGVNNNQYVGCLNCDIYDTSSIWNTYGDDGSVYSDTSIWNTYGDYGGIYSDYSPWNTYSSNPPVVVDRNGNFYGYFTLNQYAGQRLEDDLTLTLYQYHNSIKDDVNGWYYKLFQ